jgi:hypothetical protein
VVVVAFYTGNDPLDSFLMAYSHERFRDLRPNPRLSSADVPKVKFPAPESEWWPVKFDGGIETVFTPTLRFGANQNHEAIEAGYGVMAKVCEPISARAKSLGIATVFTIIPSKELVYWPKIRQAQIEVPEAYSKLIVAEQRNIDALAKRLKTLKNARYVDAVKQLQSAAMGAKALYPSNINGHPLAAGYDVIGKAVAETVGQLLPVPPQGLVALQVGEDAYQLYAVKGGEAWWFTSADSVVANGWDLERASQVSLRELAGLEKRIVDGVDIRRFGPR